MIIAYIDKDTWEELKYKVARNKPLPTPFYGSEEFGEDEFYVATKRVETWLSVEIVTSVLAEQIDIGNGVTRWKAIKKDDVTPKMLKLAGKL